MTTILKYAPYMVIFISLLFAIFTIVNSKNLRKVILESHKEKSEYSWTRVMGSVIVFSAVVIAMAQSIHALNGEEVSITLVISMLGIAIGGKVAQKRNEKGELETTVETKKKEDE